MEGVRVKTISAFTRGINLIPFEVSIMTNTLVEFLGQHMVLPPPPPRVIDVNFNNIGRAPTHQDIRKFYLIFITGMINCFFYFISFKNLLIFNLFNNKINK